MAILNSCPNTEFYRNGGASKDRDVLAYISLSYIYADTDARVSTGAITTAARRLTENRLRALADSFPDSIHTAEALFWLASSSEHDGNYGRCVTGIEIFAIAFLLRIVRRKRPAHFGGLIRIVLHFSCN